jgi:sensor histidine kinase YesM
LFFVYPLAKQDFILLSGLICLAYFGVILSYFLAFIFNKVNITKRKLSNISITVVIASVLLAHLWSLEINIIDIALSNMGYKVSHYSLKYYFWEIITQSAILISWSSIYLTLIFMKQREENHQLELKIKEIESKKFQSELIALKSQLNPHFLSTF